MIIDRIPIATAADRVVVTDALLRFGAGVDHDDVGLIASAFGEGAVVDFGPCGREMGLEYPVFTGGATIVRCMAPSPRRRRRPM